MSKQIIQIELNGSPLENDVHKRALEVFAKLPLEDQNRICELIKNPKALTALKKNWTMLKLMFK